MKNNEDVIVEQTYNKPAEKVWDAITNSKVMKSWLFKEIESFKPEVGFKTQFNIREKGTNYMHVWKITDVKPGKKLEYEWTFKGIPGDSYVKWELFPDKNKTKLKLTHKGIDSFPKDNPDLSIKSFLEGWSSLLKKNLKEYLEKE
jgi:uncharacterized protein YndB with AHSA1/START domain